MMSRFSILFPVILAFSPVTSLLAQPSFQFTEVGVSAGVDVSENVHGVSWGDYDNDDDLDLFMTNSDGLTRLFRNNGDSPFTDVTSSAGVSENLSGAITWGDYDNDGDIDLFLTHSGGPHRLYRNNGDGTFTDVAPSAGISSTGPGPAAWGDYDNDGDLDLYPTDFSASGNGVRWLYRNNGDGTFTDVAPSAGLNDSGLVQGMGWGDYDNDGDLDLCVTRLSDTTRLYRNRGNSTFIDTASSAGISTTIGAFVSWGDFDNDGDLDLYMPNPGGDRLYRNNGDGTFTDIAPSAGLNGNGGNGPGWGDYDNDGDLDLYQSIDGSANRLYRNNGDSTFTDVAADEGVADPGQARGIAWGDYDNDGDLDLYLSNNGTNRLYRNNGTANQWLVVKVVGTASNRSGIGAQVTVVTGAVRQRRDVEGGIDVYSQPSLPVEFGLGSMTAVDSLIVLWPSGIRQTLTNVGVNQIRTVTEPVEISLSNITATYSESLEIPIRISDTSGQDIVSAEVFLAYDGDILTATGADATGTLLTSNWSVETNLVQGVAASIDTIKMAMATDDDMLSGAGTLINVNFQVANLRYPASSPLTLTHVLFNDGTPDYTKIDGSVTLIGTDGVITSLPGEIIPRWSVGVSVIDADADLDGTPGTDQVSVDIENIGSGDTVTLILDETAATAGSFTGHVDTEFGLVALADGLIQGQAEEEIVFTFVDELDSAGDGPIDRTATTDVIGGTDGTVATTLVSQPGDPLYIQVTDADLNTDDGEAETVDVIVSNSRTLETFTVTLEEADAADAVFFGVLATLPGASTPTEMNTAEEDVLTVTYDDVVTEVGSQVDRTAVDDVIDPWGDADDNEQLQAFDAAQVLFDVLSAGTHLSPLGRRSANVDIQPVTSGINPFDASLILQKRVGLIATFPVQDPAAENHPQGAPASPKAVPDVRRLSLVADEGYVRLMVDARGGILAGDLLLDGVTGRVEMGEELASFLSASRTEEEGLHIVFAGVQAVAGPGEILRVYGVGPGDARLVRAVFNNGEIEGAAWDRVELVSTPLSFALHANAPNPFNPETTIRFDLPQESVVHLEVFDAVGQYVRRLVAESLSAGMHQVVWDGRGENGEPVSSGVYFCRLQAQHAGGEFSQVRRMLLLK